IGAHPEEIIFTSGGTEAINMAIRGVARANRDRGNHIITSAVEHHAVLDTCRDLAAEGFEVTVVPVDEYGMVNVEEVAAAITDRTVLISVMHANNEVGTLQPVAQIGVLARSRGIYFHSDTVQSVGKVPFTVDDLHVDMISISGHKIYGPKGIGLLYLRRGTRWQPVAAGGGQERGRRPGTENVPGIIGLGEAMAGLSAHLEREAPRLEGLRRRLIEGVTSRVPDARVNGHPTEHLPNVVNFSFPGLEAEALLISLDIKGIAASAGSACASGALEPSHVLLAMGLPKDLARGSLRLSLGKDNTEAEVDYFLGVLPDLVARLRAVASGAAAPVS
ncbi:MAG: aminotransferase class V-fold PLP-dependent enzyme, partial [Firmicutes bacterium]|nr:aminotransferase class V-fold PLP-dependent enzyme [Bacillota bacterium]